MAGSVASNGPLSGIIVLDPGSVWAWPYAGRLLGALGATVVKVEAPQRPDGPRPPADWDGCWGAFGDLNRGKLGLDIDLARPSGRAAFIDLAERADVVLESFTPRVMPYSSPYSHV